MSGWTTLVQAETLSMGLSRTDLAIVDCRFTLVDPHAGESAYRQSHVPGAVYAHLDRDLASPGKQGHGRHPWPTLDGFLACLGRWGISPHGQVVAYDEGDGSIAARLWYLLRALGHEKVAVLDGGWTRWVSLGMPTESHAPPRMTTRYQARFDEGRWLDAAGVQGHLNAGGLLLDARARARFRGDAEPIDRVAGHVPGALNRPYSQNMASGRLKSPVQLAAEYRALIKDRSPGEVVVMCGSGVTACHVLLAMERAGLKGAKLYAGSWSDWIGDPSRPVAVGD